MKYNILVISDIHWGVVNPKEQSDSLEFFKEFIRQYGDDCIDLVVIAGDYWDSKLSLNSKDAIIAIDWFHDLYQMCIDRQITLRMFQGTSTHDNDQLEVFMPLTREKETNAFGRKPFDIFMSMTVEETLPDLLCCYCPDEDIQTYEYEKMYLNQILQMKDIGFFHGTFDLVYGNLLESQPEILEKNNVIFRYNMWAPQIKGPLISGHWHDGKQYEELYYTGSPFRWKFREDEKKGFLFIQYDTSDSSYYIKKIINPLAANYYTYEIYTNTFETKDDYVKILNDINRVIDSIKESSTEDKLRIMYYITDDKDENDIFLSALRQEITKFKNCKITIKNKLKNKKRKESERKINDEKKEVGFIFDDGFKPANKIHDFIIRDTDNEVDVPLDFINTKMNQYL